jgi:VIT1/CCC1 family predicted Fe2+/Mn2+ transporter
MFPFMANLSRIIKTHSETHLSNRIGWLRAACFTDGAVLLLLVVIISPPTLPTYTAIASSLVSLAVLGAVGAKTGGVELLIPTLHVLFWGALSLGLTTLVGVLFRLKS